jgi:hypothetical protein
LALDTETELKLHEGAVVVSFQIQHSVPTVWVMSDPKGPIVPRKVIARGTGEEIPDGWVYVGTAQVYAGDLTFHLFVEPSPAQP